MSLQGLFREPKFLITFLFACTLPVLGAHFNLLGSFLVVWNLREFYRADFMASLVFLLIYGAVQIFFLSFSLSRIPANDFLNTFLVSQTALAALLGALAFWHLIRMLRENHAGGFTFFQASGVAILIQLIILLVSQGVGTAFFHVDFMGAVVKNIKAAIEPYQKNLQEVQKESFRIFLNFWPSLLLISQLVIFYTIGRLYLAFYVRHPSSAAASLRVLTLPPLLVWFVIAGWGTLLLMRWAPALAPAKIPLMNLLAVSTFLYFAQGLGILSHFLAGFNRGVLPHLIAILIAALLVRFQPGALVIVFTLTVGFGLGDQWFNYRRIGVAKPPSNP
ncbi:MAG: DUF2232 domain-containing protein [Spirochaetia bacterium]|nr:DUF2232 domain-containing protein [Spirochaetia bacterium]